MTQFLAVYNSRTLTLTATDARVAQREAARRFRARHRHQVSVVRVGENFLLKTSQIRKD